MFGQILGAVAGPLVGALFGNKGRGGPSPSDNVNSLAKGAREAAEKYGFNPLTLLQAGSGAASLGGSAPALSSGAYISEAISRGVDTYFNVKQERADQEAEAIRSATEHMERVRGQQARDPLQRFGYALTDVAPVPVAKANGGGVAPTYPLGVDIPVPDPLLNRGTGLFIGGHQWKPAPGWSTGQSFEDEYGDTPLSWPYAAAKMGADVKYNLPALGGFGDYGDYAAVAPKAATKNTLKAIGGPVWDALGKLKPYGGFRRPDGVTLSPDSFVWGY